MNEQTKKRLLLINPNTNTAVTQHLESFFNAHLPSLVHIDGVTASFGASYISCEASHAVAAHATLDCWAHYLTEKPAPDGVLIGCFGDPGLFALRESSACPVTGLAEASFIEAASLGEFAIVTGGKQWKPILMRLAQNLGFENHLRHIEIVEATGAQLLADPVMARACLRQACVSASAKGVKSIVLGGAGLAGYAQQLQSQCDIPLIDSAMAGLRVLLEGKLKAPSVQKDGFEANWSSISNQMNSLRRK